MKKPIIFTTMLISTRSYSQYCAFPVQSNAFAEVDKLSADSPAGNGIPTGGLTDDNPRDASLGDRFLCFFYAL